MASQRLLQREKYIRIAGLFLMVSPFFNLTVSIYAALKHYNRALNTDVLAQILKNIPIHVWALWLPVFITGFMMFKGRRASWKVVLGLLGVFIGFNIVNFKNDMALGWFQPTLYLLTNISLFALVYSQEFHQEAQKKGLELIRKMRETKANGPTVHFDGVGPWAKMIAITTTHISMKAFNTPPSDIQTRILEIALSPDLVLRARYSQHIKNSSGQDEYFFDLVEMDTRTRHRFEDWLVLKKYAKFKSAQAA